MITWLKKLRISAALDSDKGFSSSLRKTVAASTELRTFGEKAEALATSFSNQALKCQPPPALHDSIMRAVRHAPVEQCPEARAADTSTAGILGRLSGASWRLGAGLAVLLAICLWWVSQHQTTSPPAAGPATGAPLTAAAQALDLGNKIPVIQNSLMAPLSDEMDRLRLDLTNAVEVVVASLP